VHGGAGDGVTGMARRAVSRLGVRRRDELPGRAPARRVWSAGRAGGGVACTTVHTASRRGVHDELAWRAAASRAQRAGGACGGVAGAVSSVVDNGATDTWLPTKC
jgi:hypothetical protein